MMYCPVTFRIDLLIKIRILFRQKFVCLKSIEPQQKTRLIQPVFPKKRRFLTNCRQRCVLIDIDKGRIKYALHLKFAIQRLGNRHDLIITFSRRPNNHLCTLSCRNKIPVRVRQISHNLRCTPIRNRKILCNIILLCNSFRSLHLCEIPALFRNGICILLPDGLDTLLIILQPRITVPHLCQLVII